MSPRDQGATEIWQMGMVELVSAIHNREVSALEAVTSCLARHGEIDSAVGAVPLMFEEPALARAREADAALRAGERWGPLHGVPVVVKANCDVAGRANTHGLKLLSGNVAGENAPVVDNLLNAGAVLIGLSNTPEFALRWHTESDAYGATVNPWNREITPGGSSGGAAAALITGQCPIAHGNDYGGSLRFPALCCGVATLRPSLGRVPQYNATQPEELGITVQLMAVQGPMARRVEDLRLGLQVMARKDARDPHWVPAPFLKPDKDRPLRIAVTFDPGGEGDVDPQIEDAVRKAAAFLEERGCHLEVVEPPGPSQAHDLYSQLVVNELRQRYAHDIRPLLKGAALEAFENLLGTVPDVEPADLLKALSERTRFMRAWSLFFERYDLILGPVSTKMPFRVGDDAISADRHKGLFRSLRLLTVCNLLGLPAAAVPVGVSGGMPQVVQLIGRWFCEETCLDAAAMLEAVAGPARPMEPRPGPGRDEKL